MLAQQAAHLETLQSVEDIWTGAQSALSKHGIEFFNYLTVDQNFQNPQLLSNISEIYGERPPEQDPFLLHCCESYDITLTGAAFMAEYDYLSPESQAFISKATETGFLTGLGIPMRLRGSTRFGGFNLGTRYERDAFERRVLPKKEELRTFCLILHRRIEELASAVTAGSEDNKDDGFRQLLIAPEANVLAELSAREQEVAHLIAAGYSRKESARLCGISPHTASDYIKSAYRKLGINDRVKLAKLLNKPS